MIAATVARPGGGASRPGLRVGLIDHALAPVGAVLDRAALARLKLSLGVVVSAEALFSLTDLYGLDPEDAIATAVHAATTLTRAALPEKR